ncbi:MAG: hypothetical protein GY765_40665, partial [bacterium]|nr:hypothetical protein [bacterium]
VIEVDDNQDVQFFSALLKRIKFTDTIKIDVSPEIPRKDMPIEWSKKNADIMALAGICKDNPITMEEIREKAWKRI